MVNAGQTDYTNDGCCEISCASAMSGLETAGKCGGNRAAAKSTSTDPCSYDVCDENTCCPMLCANAGLTCPSPSTSEIPVKECNEQSSDLNEQCSTASGGGCACLVNCNAWGANDGTCSDPTKVLNTNQGNQQCSGTCATAAVGTCAGGASTECTSVANQPTIATACTSTLDSTGAACAWTETVSGGADRTSSSDCSAGNNEDCDDKNRCETSAAAPATWTISCDETECCVNPPSCGHKSRTPIGSSGCMCGSTNPSHCAANKYCYNPNDVQSTTDQSQFTCQTAIAPARCGSTSDPSKPGDFTCDAGTETVDQHIADQCATDNSCTKAKCCTVASCPGEWLYCLCVFVFVTHTKLFFLSRSFFFLFLPHRR